MAEENRSMAPSTPAKITDQTTDELSAVPSQPDALAAQTRLTPQMLKALEEHGFKLPEIKRRAIPYYWKIAWDELCTLRTKDPKVWASPLMVVTGVTAFPEAEKVFDDYQGFIRVEFFAEDGEPYAVTHAYMYAQTGELTPLAAWMQEQPPPFYARIGYVETRKEGRHVVRPLPLDIEIR